MQHLIKNWGKHAVAIAIFLVLSIVFFAPAIFEGKTIVQLDNIKAVGMGGSQMQQYADTAEPGEFSVWSDAMFGGMPHVAVYGSPAPNLPGVETIEHPMKAIDYTGASMLFIGLVCFYLLMCVMGVNWWLAIAGAIAFAFASYNIIIIQAGHIVKAYVIAYMPVTLAGMALLFKRKHLWGGVLFLLGVAFSISNGHAQITYYLVLLCLPIYIGFVVEKFREKALPELLKVSAIMAAAVILAVLPNAKHMYANWELSQTSTRGATELTTTTADGERISSGLEKGYAFEWSYEKSELLTVLIPNIFGGSSGGSVGPDSELHKAMRANGQQVGREIQTATYWGDKMFTSGPVYFGALVCFLFVLGMFVVRSSYKWWMFAGATLLTFLAFGRHLDWFNDIMFHYLPMYNKFRTVEMALVIPGLVAPIIAMWGLKEIFQGEVEEKQLKNGFIAALSITGGLSLITWIAPTLFFSFQSSLDANYQFPDWYYNALILDRASLASADALRSLIFILLGAGLLFWYMKAKDKARTATFVSAGIALLILIDLWAVDKRYLNESHFSTQKVHETYRETVADKEILNDTDPSFRVLNLNNPFQETTTSYFHKSIGGYHAVKLGRYQELIEHRLGNEYSYIIQTFQTAETIDDIYEALALCPSLNMLNMRYIVYHPEQPPLGNPFAFGNAWFVSDIRIVENADAEIAALDEINPIVTAVIDKRFADQMEGFIPRADSTATITLDSYRPNRLTYTSNSTVDQLAVFSEIYYQPGWRVTVNGEPAPHFRTNWTLRGMIVPAGENKIVFEHYPETYVAMANISAYSSFIILLLLIGAAVYSLYNVYRRKEE